MSIINVSETKVERRGNFKTPFGCCCCLINKVYLSYYCCKETKTKLIAKSAPNKMCHL